MMLAGSLAAVLFMAWAAKALGLGGAAFADESAAMAEAEALVPDFAAVSAVLRDDGATVTGADGRRIHLRPHGARWRAE